jgi:hypothetical protein
VLLNSGFALTVDPLLFRQKMGKTIFRGVSSALRGYLAPAPWCGHGESQSRSAGERKYVGMRLLSTSSEFSYEKNAQVLHR